MQVSKPGDPVPAARSKDIAMLPLFAQSLVACRLGRRAALALLSSADQRLVLDACEAIESISKHGDGWHTDHPAMNSLTKVRRTCENEAVLEAIRWAFDSVGAAQGALDFSVDATVTASAQRCINAVCDDPRTSCLQVMILVESDIEQIAFACKEGHINTYDGLTDHVLSRLTPCHALTVLEPQRSMEEEYR